MTPRNTEPAPLPPLSLDVIIVDDEPTARRTLRECCVREPDLRIIGEYGDSRSALEAIRSQPPSAVPGYPDRFAERGGNRARPGSQQTAPHCVCDGIRSVRAGGI